MLVVLPHVKLELPVSDEIPNPRTNCSTRHTCRERGHLAVRQRVGAMFQPGSSAGTGGKACTSQGLAHCGLCLIAGNGTKSCED